jgi:large subunit ribosomal protein L10
MRREQKVERVEELKELFSKNETFIVTTVTGITVNSVNSLRKKLHADDIRYVVVKNTLARLALKETGRETIADKMIGNNVIAFSGSDPVKAAKIFKDFSKQEKKFEVKFGVLDQDYLDNKQVEALADLPDHTTLIATFAMLLNTPLTNFARLLKEPVSGFARLLNQMAEKKEN